MKRRGGQLLGAGVIVALLGIAATSAVAIERPQGLGDVKDVRTWSYPDYTRVVVELSQIVDPEVHRLTADTASGRPDRLYLDMEGIWVGRRYDSGIPVRDGLLKGLRLGQNTLHRSRLVIDLENYESHRRIILDAPPRIVVDVYGSRMAPEALRWPLPKNRQGAPPTRLGPDFRSVTRVVIDPGHGGSDPGAIGLGGLQEKDVNLRLGRMLATRLAREGFEVVMTRETDEHLDLEERTAIAEARRGDVFISLHANASARGHTRGLEIYYLDEDYEHHNIEVAARENGVSTKGVDSLQRTLANLRIGETSRQSERLAQLVHRHTQGLEAVPRGMPDLGVKKGPFYVLFLSSMPSILVEAGFVTNRADSKLLRDGDFLESMADKIAKGLRQYRESPNLLARREGL